MKILVTGGAGFIGSHLVNRLVSRGENLVVVDNFNRFYSPVLKEKNIMAHKNKPNFRLERADIRSKSAMEKIFSKNKIDCVVHLAAMAGVRPSIEKPGLYAEVNVMGTLNLLELIKMFKVPQLVFGSSSSVYGERKSGPFKETDNTDQQISPYGATKKAGELLCHTYAHLYGIKTTILRLFTVYGPRNRPDMACFKFMDSLLKNRPILRFGKGNTGRDYTNIDDVIDGLEAAIDKPLAFEIINLGNSSPVKLNKLISALELEVGRKATIRQLPIPQGDVKLTYADISKAKRLLSFAPRVSLREGLKRLHAWYAKPST